ncbi:MAG: hypothetical protein M1423_03910 [Acidobacteria bacterium]|nr:hypothetical protein [Acidobacteriota bacterium]
MADVNNAIFIVPSSQFKWTFEVQYMESLPTREEAIRYASQKKCNLIVEYSKRSGPLFDVMLDPERVCESENSVDPIETVQPIKEYEQASWGKLMFRRAFRLGRRLATGVRDSNHKNAAPTVPSQALEAKS